MKNIFIADLVTLPMGTEVELWGWLSSKRASKNIVFYDVVDSTGKIQIVLSKDMDNAIEEESVKIVGVLSREKQLEIKAKEISVIGRVQMNLEPHPRKDFDVFSEENSANILDNRHLFLRNPRLIATMKARNLVMTAVHEWFRLNKYYEVTAPILSPVLLYSDDTGIKVDLNNSDNNIFLTQCVGFYLESAVHVLEKVYNIGPSFRGKETSSKRHLTEYWHIKSELAFCEFEEFFPVVEDMLFSITKNIENQAKILSGQLGKVFCTDGYKIPFPRITYIEVIDLLNKNKINIDFGKSLNAKAEAFLSEYFKSPVWITHNPADIEGFPYRFFGNDKRLTLTADLICSNGHGELLGIAEKTADLEELEQRMKEKGKDKNPSYNWLKDLRKYGAIPHCGLGMGLERLIKWLFDLNHVRDAIPFPRNIGRKIYP